MSSEMINGEGSIEGDFSAEATASDLMNFVQSAAQIADGPQRDAALLAALRICRRELEAAEAEAAVTQLRVSEAKDMFHCAAELLSGASPSSLWESAGSSTTTGSGGGTNGKLGERSLSSDTDQYWKRSKTSVASVSTETESGSRVPMDAPNHGVVVPTNPIHMPPTYTSGDALMSEEMVASHRENFYQKLLGVSADQVEDYTPNLSHANLRSKAQLVDGIHIVRHWDTGADGMDAASFRSKHKTWYTKMKPLSHNLGRRTGIHLRSVEPQHEYEGEGETVLCRYNKDGTKSTVYLDLTQLYDALFEVHCLKHGHLRGKEAVKSHVDELYANVPDSQVKVFLDTCPVCMERRRINLNQDDVKLAIC